MDEKKIGEIELLKDAGRYEEAIRQILIALVGATDDVEKARYLMNLVVCTTNCDMRAMAADAINDLYKLSLPPDWRPIRNYVAAVSYLDFGSHRKALELIYENLSDPILMTDGFAGERYQNFAQCGFALTHLERYAEALASLNKAEDICPQGDLKANIKLYKVSCLGRLGRSDEAFLLAQEVANSESGDLAVRAKYHMAEIRFAQARFIEAIAFYKDVEQHLPCSMVSAEDVKRDIATAMDGVTKDAKELQ